MLKKIVLLALLALLLTAQAPDMSITAVPSAAEVNQVVTLVAVGDVSQDYIWSLSGGEWCLFNACFWRSDDDLRSTRNPLWRATAPGTYTITLTPPTGSAVTVAITVAEP